ncbi:hypothetical protein BCV72DRAFT_315192 [Rhizopus microsporus var. microsporus]|uniref:Uncharacterized protein n=1 Tax=Rhizopus microsporus var. microsporus TaxID=86635 RepID=A0A1X0RE63_RHIZD|nr:hypothetical protein BCV72DRAFT_315192 [Rhizopus microsporus var. microsporus]
MLCECGRNDDQTKELYDNDCKMAQVLKEIVCALYQKSSDALCEITFVDFLLFGKAKFTIILYDSSTGYVCHINYAKAADLSKEPGGLCSELLPC